MGPDDLEVKHLDRENAWKLFRQKVRANVLESSKILELARIVCGKCKGLPLALKVISETMAIKSTEHEWRHAIKVLDLNADGYPAVKDEILKVLKLSYDFLEDVTYQQCLLYCALFPEDYKIKKRQVETISVIPDCPHLTTLILRKNKLVSISGKCFLSMPNLVVLDLSWNKPLEKLPEEVSHLVSLKYLGLAGTALEELPLGLRELIQLRHLDLNSMNNLRSISLISSLLNLEILKVYDSAPLSMALIRVIESLKNLKLLSVTITKLSVLERFLSIPRLTSCTHELYLYLGEYEAENISLAATAASLFKLQIRRSSVTYLMEDTRYRCRSPSTVSFQNLKYVALVDVSGIQDLTWLLFAPSLTILHTMKLSDVREIISRKKVSRIEGSSIRPFQELRTLGLIGLKELTSIYWEPLVFPVLTTLVILGCPNLKKLPRNKESSKGNHLRLQSDDKKWSDGIEWEDEETKARLLH